MKKFFEVADRYVMESDWKVLAMLKLCLCSVGVMIGLSIPREKKKIPFMIAAIVFVVTYIPLMAKYFKTWKEEKL